MSDGNGKPSIIKFNYGSGKVILFAYHPDVLIHSMVDQLELSLFYKEKLIEWKTGDQEWSEINLHSWNIVHAAMQIAAGQAVTALTTLP